MPNAENLKPDGRWKKGRSGNPKGRPPKARCIASILDRLGAQRLPPELRDRIGCTTPRISPTMLDAVLRRVYLAALDGEGWAVQFIAERTEGKVKDTLKLEGGQRLQIVEELVEADRCPDKR
jgi:hypothetical protein